MREFPLSIEELELLRNDAGQVNVVIPIRLDDIINVDGVTAFNDMVSEKITGVESGLTDISAEAIGIQYEDILIEVTGNVSNFLGREA